jgi:hypothetical protein
LREDLQVTYFIENYNKKEFSVILTSRKLVGNSPSSKSINLANESNDAITDEAVR